MLVFLTDRKRVSSLLKHTQPKGGGCRGNENGAFLPSDHNEEPNRRFEVDPRTNGKVLASFDTWSNLNEVFHTSLPVTRVQQT